MEIIDNDKQVMITFYFYKIIDALRNFYHLYNLKNVYKIYANGTKSRKASQWVLLGFTCMWRNKNATWL